MSKARTARKRDNEGMDLPSQKPSQTPIVRPVLGDKVTVGRSTSVYTVNRVSEDGREVNLYLEGTNMEQFRVPVTDLKIVEHSPRRARQTESHSVVEAVRERLVIAQHENIQRLSGEVAQLKQLLKFDGAPSIVGRDLDNLRDQVEESWDTAISNILERLEK